jgi:hypothetical protein
MAVSCAFQTTYPVKKEIQEFNQDTLKWTLIYRKLFERNKMRESFSVKANEVLELTH